MTYSGAIVVRSGGFALDHLGIDPINHRPAGVAGVVALVAVGLARRVPKGGGPPVLTDHIQRDGRLPASAHPCAHSPPPTATGAARAASRAAFMASKSLAT